MSFPSQAVFTSAGRAQPLRFSLTLQETKCLMSDDLLLAFGGAWLAIIVVKGVVARVCFAISTACVYGTELCPIVSVCSPKRIVLAAEDDH
jgi:hypothetical protein